MIVNFDYEKLSNIIKDFCTLTHTSVCIFDTNYIPLLACPEDPPLFCRLVKSSPLGAKACEKCDREVCIKSGLALKATSHECHMGLIDTVTPIFYDGTILCYIMFGQVKNTVSPTQQLIEIFTKKSIEYNLNVEDLLQSYKNLRHIDDLHFSATVNLLNVCAKYIYISNMIHLKRDGILEDITSYLDNNYTQNITIDELTKQFFISRSKLYSIFKAIPAKTPLNYINNLRLQQAEIFLSQTEKSISQISIELGFSDYNYFIRLFHKRYNTSPLQYRKKMLKNIVFKR